MACNPITSILLHGQNTDLLWKPLSENPVLHFEFGEIELIQFEGHW